jgi:hypothetical protein
MNDSQFQELNDKLDVLIRLGATQIAYGKDYREQVEILSRAGVHPKEIAKIVGKSQNNVKVTLHLMRRKQNGK